MLPTTFSDLRVLICEDEQLLAIDMAEQMQSLGAMIVAIVGSLAELEEILRTGTMNANAAILDVGLIDGPVYALVPALERQGIAVAFCTGYHQQERPETLKHLAWFGKPARCDEIAQALCLAIDGRSDT